jgi:O-antigen ligase
MVIRFFNLLFGVGTGDLKKSFKEQYNRHHTKLEEKNQLRAHNQFLTFFITYGVVGGVLFFLFFFYPLVFKSIRSNPYYVVLIVIYAISFLTEDTLETQVGVTFYAFFHPFILRFIKPNKEV